MDTISNSETTSYTVCKRQHYYAYGMQVTSRAVKPALYRGSLGHTALEAYYLAMQAGESFLSCRKAAVDVICDEMALQLENGYEGTQCIDICVLLLKTLNDYFDNYTQEPFKVLEVEKTFTAPLIEGTDFLMILDLLVEYTAGPLRGQLVIVDHKFVFNFKSIEELEMDCQMPKYIQTLKANGYNVSKAIFNQIRHRVMKSVNPTDYFRRTPARTSKVLVGAVWEEQQYIANEIRNNPQRPIRSLSGMICKNCDYQPLCGAELNNQPITTMLKIDFKPRERRTP